MYKVTKDDSNDYIYLHPKGDHEYTMIFLHGLGDSSSGFADVFKQGMCPKNCRIVLPTAPVAAVSCNGGSEMTSWFDIFELSPTTIPDLTKIRAMLNQDDVAKSVALLNKLIEQE